MLINAVTSVFNWHLCKVLTSKLMVKELNALHRKSARSFDALVRFFDTQRMSFYDSLYKSKK